MHFETLEEAFRYQQHYESLVKGAANCIRQTLFNIDIDLTNKKYKPHFGIVLGSGLGDLIPPKDVVIAMNYNDIPNFPQLTVPGHEGKILIGEIAGVPIIGLKGRKHFYEVADNPMNTGMLQVVFPVHVLAELGVKNYFATNAVGGLNPDYKVGDVMIVKSHFAKFMPDPLLGRSHEFKRVDNGENVQRFQPMNDAYDPKLRKMLIDAGADYSEHVHRGILAAVTGPSYESEGDAIALRKLGIDAVGMSVIPEVIVARNRGMNVVSMSCITNTIDSEGKNATNHEEVMKILNAPETRERLSSIVQNFFKLYREQV